MKFSFRATSRSANTGSQDRTLAGSPNPRLDDLYAAWQAARKPCVERPAADRSHGLKEGVQNPSPQADDRRGIDRPSDGSLLSLFGGDSSAAPLHMMLDATLIQVVSERSGLRPALL